MGKINVLPQSVAELIAAGEVIDRPASIVKELVENALDASAKRITVEIKNGGIVYLRVSDDGSGMERDDVPLAFIRHATSKIASASDLDAIGTLGFRGEALPSIAAVSRVKVTTRTAKNPLGCCFEIDGSGENKLYDTGCAVGTVFEVRDVFYNTPARMKFLKKDVTEANAVASLMDRLALANPDVAFELIRDGKRTLKTPGDGNTISAVRMICGGEVAAGMIPVFYKGEGITISGLISRPSVFRTTRSLQAFFINSRYVRSRTCAGAVEEAYKNRLMIGRFPACVINLQIDCTQVDVNVHPAKLEVRFSNERLVYNTVYSACMEALSEYENKLAENRPKKKISVFSLSDFDYSDNQISFKNVPAQAVKQQTLRKDFTADITARPDAIPQTAVKHEPLFLHDDSEKTFEPSLTAQMSQMPKQAALKTNRYALDIECDREPITSEKESERAVFIKETPPDIKQPPKEILTEENPNEPVAAAEFEPPAQTLDKAPDKQAVEPYRVIGELFDTYLLVEQQNSFILIDKHAAHERYIYNRIKHLEHTEDKQLLLSPQAITLPRDEYFALSEHPEALKALGIAAEDFGEGTLLVRELPMLLDGFSLSELLGEVAKRIIAQRNSITPELLDHLLYSVSCRAAVMAGKSSTMPEMKRLADMVLGEEKICHCPHGRPVMTILSRRDVEKMFGRMG